MLNLVITNLFIGLYFLQNSASSFKNGEISDFDDYHYDDEDDYNSIREVSRKESPSKAKVSFSSIIGNLSI